MRHTPPLPPDAIDLVPALCGKFPLRSRAKDTRDGYTAEVVGVGTSRGQLAVWLDGRPAVPAARVRVAS